MRFMSRTAPVESVLWDDWHVVATLETLRRLGQIATALFARELIVRPDGDGATVAYADGAGVVASCVHYGFVWASLGTPQREIVTFAEAAEPDRHVLPVGSLGMRVSGLRLIENFLDVGHFPFVHTGYLGAEPYTEVLPYEVSASADQIVITGCECVQPKSSPDATEGMDVEYIFRVLRPYAAALHKTNPVEPARFDIIAIFVQPVNEERCVAHVLALNLKFGESAGAVRSFQRLITGQDQPILENQLPRRLPLEPRAELPVRADLGGTTYRRWLHERGVAYGAIPRAG